MDFFYKHLLNKEIKRILNESKRKREFRNLKEVKSVLIVFDAADYEVVDECYALLNQAGKKIYTIAYQKKISDSEAQCNADFIVTDSDIHHKQSTNMNNIKRLLKNSKFDLAIDMTQKANILLQYVLVLANASLKVGFSKTKRQIHDMLILAPADDENKSSMQNLEKQMIYYLSTISSH
jgi:ADP-heptose:LPS heptosyltransferase